MVELTGRGPGVSQRQPESRLLIVVSRAQPDQHRYLSHAFAPEAIEVVLDRRLAVRRQREEQARSEKRRRERRQRDVNGDLQTFGWAVARR